MSLKKLLKKDANYINIGLGGLILVVLLYVGILIPVGHSAPVNYSENRLSLDIQPGFDPNSLNNDLTGLRQAQAQLNSDTAYAENGLAAAKQSVSTLDDLNGAISLCLLLTKEVSVLTQPSFNQVSALSSRVNSVTSELNSLKGEALDTATAKTITSQYQSLLSQVELIKVADDQQVIFIRMNKLIQILPAEFNVVATQGQPVTDLYADLTTISGDVSSGSALAKSAEAALISNNRQSNSQLSRINSNLQSGQRDISAGINAATTIINDLLAI